MAGFQRDNPVIRIRCLVRDILDAATALAEQRAGTFFAGKVSYEKEMELLKRAKSAHSSEMKEIARAAANLLLRKRSAFRFENEVRTLWLDHTAHSTAVFLPVDAKSVVRQVMCSPHTHPLQTARIRQEFKDRFDVDVIESGILRLPQ
jgi:hypothetical protein